MRGTLLLFAVLWAALFLTAACMDPTPSGPSVDLSGSTGNNNVAISTGSSSPVGTAPCGAQGGPQKGNGLAAPTCDNSTTTLPPETPTEPPAP